MILLASIIKEFAEGFSRQYHPLPSHKQALSAMERCRKHHSPYMIAHCTNDLCREHSYVPHSCGHRNCPHCQSHESQQWIENQLEKQLPGQYFLVTFTLPKQLHDLAWRNQSEVYSILFNASQELLKTFTANDKKMRGSAGFTAVLHTHSRRLEFHPHVHVVMPGASINQKDKTWRMKLGKYLFNHKALAKVFRAKILGAFTAYNLPIPANIPGKWVVDCKNVGRGDKALIYLGRYLYKGVIQEKDILKNENGMVTFRYFDSQRKKYQTRTVTGEYFLYLLMLHVLPKGFRRTRCYGFLHPCSKKLIKLLQLVLRINPLRMIKKVRERAKIICPACGAVMRIVKTRIRQLASTPLLELNSPGGHIM
jgi:hypothetical protein